MLKVIAESDFLTAHEHKHHPHYREFAFPWDIPFSCLTTLQRDEDMLIGLAVLRSQREGHIEREQREAFAAIAPFVRAAVGTQIALEGQGTALLAGTMEALSIPAFICDRAGCVKALTPDAEALVTGKRGLELKAQRLQATLPCDARRLSEAIRAAANEIVKPGRSVLQTVVLRGCARHVQPLALDVIALPARQYEFSFAPRVLVVARGSKGANARKAAILRAAYSLTCAEVDIAMRLSAGKTPEAIATRRGVSVGTVRAQIKTILAKLGVKRQIELVATVSQL